jgi:tetratricopeptide (TPR) repeat protein
MSARATARCGEGLAAQARGDHPAACAAFGEAVALAPDRHDLRLVLTFALAAAGRTAHAISTLEALPDLSRLNTAAVREVADAALAIGADAMAARAIHALLQSTPHDAAMHGALGALAERADRMDEATLHLARALTLDPRLVSALITRARLEARRGAWENAYETLDAAVRLAPQHAHARYQRGLVALTMGRLAEGWTDAEARRTLPWHLTAAPRGVPAWDGVPRTGQPLLVWGEQGLGDQLQFVRFLPELRRLARDRVVLHVAPSVRTLVADAFPDIETVALGSVVPIGAAHVPMMSLPWLLGLTAEADVSRAAYLATPYRLRSPAGRVPRIGVCWAGNPRHAHDRARSVPLEELLSLVTALSADWVSLQVGDAEASRAHHAVLGAAMRAPDAPLSDFRDTAALIGTLDAVITVDTAVAHLSGALGVPTWTLIASLPDWRWQLERTDSPWYASMRLVRAAAGESWSAVLPRAARQMADYFRGNEDVRAA